MATKGSIIRRTFGAPAPSAANPFGPGVDYQSNIAGWRHPQYMPASPHRLPSLSPGFVLPSGSTSGNAPILAPGPGSQTGILDPHHYAKIASGNIIASVLAAAPLFLAAPPGYRNFLLVRCPAANAGNVYLDFNQPASANSPIKIEADQTYLFDEVVPQDDLYAFGDAAGQVLIFAYSNIALPVTQ